MPAEARPTMNRARARSWGALETIRAPNVRIFWNIILFDSPPFESWIYGTSGKLAQSFSHWHEANLAPSRRNEVITGSIRTITTVTVSNIPSQDKVLGLG